jgi:hypothetical protein
MNVHVVIYRQSDGQRLLGFHTELTHFTSYSRNSFGGIKWDDLVFHVNILALDSLVMSEPVDIEITSKDVAMFRAHGCMIGYQVYHNTGVATVTFGISTVSIGLEPPTDDYLTAYNRAMAIVKQ